MQSATLPTQHALGLQPSVDEEIIVKFHGDADEKPKATETKSQATKSTSSQSDHWLIDVDDTLMIMLPDGTPFFNKELIAFLKEKQVTSISLFTRMDASNYKYSSAIRLPLIRVLQENGIKVNKVITPLDVLYSQSNPKEFKTGDTYANHMRPLEEMLEKVKKEIDSNTFQKLLALYENHYLFAAKIDFLIENNIITGEFDRNVLLNKIDTLFQDKYLELQKQGKIKHIDFQNINKSFINQLDKGIEQLKELSQNCKDNFDKDLKEIKLSPEQHKVFNDFVEMQLKYRNDNYFLKLCAKEFKEPTKGDAYQLWLNENQLSAENTVFFIDDSKMELQSVRTAHDKSNKKHQLITFLPPKPTTCPELTFRSCISASEYSNKTSIMQLKQCFNSVFKTGDYSAATRYLQIIFLLAQELEISDQEIKNLVVSIKHTKDLSKKQTPTESTLKADSFYSSVFNANVFEMQMRKIILDFQLHKLENPSLYKGSKLSESMFAPKGSNGIDHRFISNVVNPILTYALNYPNKIEVCKSLLNQIDSDLKPNCKMYKEEIQKALEKLNQLNPKKSSELKA